MRTMVEPKFARAGERVRLESIFFFFYIITKGRGNNPGIAFLPVPNLLDHYSIRTINSLHILPIN